MSDKQVPDLNQAKVAIARYKLYLMGAVDLDPHIALEARERHGKPVFRSRDHLRDYNVATLSVWGKERVMRWAGRAWYQPQGSTPTEKRRIRAGLRRVAENAGFTRTHYAPVPVVVRFLPERMEELKREAELNDVSLAEWVRRKVG